MPDRKPSSVTVLSPMDPTTKPVETCSGVQQVFLQERIRNRITWIYQEAARCALELANWTMIQVPSPNLKQL
jgi:hypothetical protein